MLGVMGIASGVGKIIGGIGARNRAAREQRRAQAEYNTNKKAFMNTDVSNPYANVTNTYEDLTVNTQAADFAAEQQQQGLANTLDRLSGAAGGSGIAALAQTLANQQSQNIRQASVDIGRQEAANQKLAARGEASMQSQRAAGENISQQRKIDKTSTLLGMSQQRLGAAKAAKAAATSSIVSGATGLLGGVAKGAILGAGMEKADISGKTKALGAQLEAGTIDQAGYQEGLKAINQGGRNFFQRVGAGLGGEIKGNYNKSNG
tara:strand:+ start:1 stop:786 length:786 start_codon:yes stop_codon:yes gene_type:complete